MFYQRSAESASGSRFSRRTRLVVGVIVFAVLLAGQAPFEVLILVLAPMAIVPLGLSLVDRPESASLEGRLLAAGATLVVPASIVFAVAFGLEQGWPAAALAFPWFLATLVFAASGGLRAWRNGARLNAGLAMAAALLFLPVGAGWSVIARAGLQPQNFSHAIVLLTGVHFHYAGFALPLLAARAIGDTPSVFGKGLVGAIVVGVPAVGVGISLSPTVEVVAAPGLAAACLGLAWIQAVQGLQGRDGNAAFLLLVSSASLTGAMVLAGVYAVGEFTDNAWLSIPAMIQSHGVLNALGFTLCGLLGRALQRRQAGATQREPLGSCVSQ
jgi:hypothetical protein